MAPHPINVWVVDDDQSVRLGHGLCLEGLPTESLEQADAGPVAAITTDGQLRAILQWKQDAWCPYKVFPVSGVS